MNAVLFFAAVD